MTDTVTAPAKCPEILWLIRTTPFARNDVVNVEFTVLVLCSFATTDLTGEVIALPDLLTSLVGRILCPAFAEAGFDIGCILDGYDTGASKEPESLHAVPSVRCSNKMGAEHNDPSQKRTYRGLLSELHRCLAGEIDSKLDPDPDQEIEYPPDPDEELAIVVYWGCTEQFEAWGIWIHQLLPPSKA